MQFQTQLFFFPDGRAVHSLCREWEVVWPLDGRSSDGGSRKTSHGSGSVLIAWLAAHRFRIWSSSPSSERTQIPPGLSVLASSPLVQSFTPPWMVQKLINNHWLSDPTILQGSVTYLIERERERGLVSSLNHGNDVENDDDDFGHDYKTDSGEWTKKVADYWLVLLLALFKLPKPLSSIGMWY